MKSQPKNKSKKSTKRLNSAALVLPPLRHCSPVLDKHQNDTSVAQLGRLPLPLTPEARRRAARFVLLAVLSPTLLTGVVVARDTQPIQA